MDMNNSNNKDCAESFSKIQMLEDEIRKIKFQLDERSEMLRIERRSREKDRREASVNEDNLRNIIREVTTTKDKEIKDLRGGSVNGSRHEESMSSMHDTATLLEQISKYKDDSEKQLRKIGELILNIETEKFVATGLRSSIDQLNVEVQKLKDDVARERVNGKSNEDNYQRENSQLKHSQVYHQNEIKSLREKLVRVENDAKMNQIYIMETKILRDKLLQAEADAKKKAEYVLQVTNSYNAIGVMYKQLVVACSEKDQLIAQANVSFQDIRSKYNTLLAEHQLLTNHLSLQATNTEELIQSNDAIMSKYTELERKYVELQQNIDMDMYHNTTTTATTIAEVENIKSTNSDQNNQAKEEEKKKFLYEVYALELSLQDACKMNDGAVSALGECKSDIYVVERERHLERKWNETQVLVAKLLQLCKSNWNDVAADMSAVRGVEEKDTFSSVTNTVTSTCGEGGGEGGGDRGKEERQEVKGMDGECDGKKTCVRVNEDGDNDDDDDDDDDDGTSVPMPVLDLRGIITPPHVSAAILSARADAASISISRDTLTENNKQLHGRLLDADDMNMLSRWIQRTSRMGDLTASPSHVADMGKVTETGHDSPQNRSFAFECIYTNSDSGWGNGNFHRACDSCVHPVVMIATMRKAKNVKFGGILLSTVESKNLQLHANQKDFTSFLFTLNPVREIKSVEDMPTEDAALDDTASVAGTDGGGSGGAGVNTSMSRNEILKINELYSNLLHLPTMYRRVGLTTNSTSEHVDEVENGIVPEFVIARLEVYQIRELLSSSSSSYERNPEALERSAMVMEGQKENNVDMRPMCSTNPSNVVDDEDGDVSCADSGSDSDATVTYVTNEEALDVVVSRKRMRREENAMKDESQEMRQVRPAPLKTPENVNAENVAGRNDQGLMLDDGEGINYKKSQRQEEVDQVHVSSVNDSCVESSMVVDMENITCALGFSASYSMLESSVNDEDATISDSRGTNIDTTTPAVVGDTITIDEEEEQQQQQPRSRSVSEVNSCNLVMEETAAAIGTYYQCTEDLNNAMDLDDGAIGGVASNNNDNGVAVAAGASPCLGNANVDDLEEGEIRNEDLSAGYFDAIGVEQEDSLAVASLSHSGVNPTWDGIQTQQQEVTNCSNSGESGAETSKQISVVPSSEKDDIDNNQIHDHGDVGHKESSGRKVSLSPTHISGYKYSDRHELSSRSETCETRVHGLKAQYSVLHDEYASLLASNNVTSINIGETLPRVEYPQNVSYAIPVTSSNSQASYESEKEYRELVKRDLQHQISIKDYEMKINYLHQQIKSSKDIPVLVPAAVDMTSIDRNVDHAERAIQEGKEGSDRSCNGDGGGDDGGGGFITVSDSNALLTSPIGNVENTERQCDDAYVQIDQSSSHSHTHSHGASPPPTHRPPPTPTAVVSSSSTSQVSPPRYQHSNSNINRLKRLFGESMISSRGAIGSGDVGHASSGEGVTGGDEEESLSASKKIKGHVEGGDM